MFNINGVCPKRGEINYWVVYLSVTHVLDLQKLIMHQLIRNSQLLRRNPFISYFLGKHSRRTQHEETSHNEQLFHTVRGGDVRKPEV